MERNRMNAQEDLETKNGRKEVGGIAKAAMIDLSNVKQSTI